MRLQINSICTDGGAQLRAADSKATVADYADAIREGAAFPPIVVFFDGHKYWLADGFHRLDAHREAGQQEIEADVRTGSKRDAILFAAGANAEHGLRRTTEDKRRAVLALLRDPEWCQWSDRDIAAKVKVDHKTVAKYRRDLNGEIPITAERRFITKHGTEGTWKIASRIDPDVSAGTGSVLSRFLAKIPTEAIVAECHRRGIEVIS